MIDHERERLADAIYDRVTTSSFTGRRLLSKIITEWVNAQPEAEQQRLHKEYVDDDEPDAG